MRITLGMMTDSIRTNLMTNADRLLEAQDAASSGKRIRRPSDDVPGIGRSLSLRSALASITQFNRNADMATTQLTTTSDVLSSAISAVHDARQLALQAASPALNESARAAIVEQLDSIMTQIAGLGNTQYLGKYILAGSASSTKPIVPDTSGTVPYVFQGDSIQFSIQVAPGIYTPTTVTGDMVFNMGGVAVPGSPDIFKTIEDLKELVLAGDVAGISSQIDHITANFDNMVAIRAQVGARLNRLESSGEVLLESENRFKQLLSQTEDADLAQAIIELRTRENVYQAAVATANRVLQMTLADFLK